MTRFFRRLATLLSSRGGDAREGSDADSGGGRCPCMEGLEFREDGTFVNPFSYAGGDGTGTSTAVIVLGIRDAVLFVRALHLWLHERFPGCHVLDGNDDEDGVRMLEEDDHHYAAVSIRMEDGSRAEFFFDDTVVWRATPAGRGRQSGSAERETYDEFAAKLASGDLSIDFARLRESFAESDVYDPYGEEPRGSMGSIDEAAAAGDWVSVLKHAESFMRICKASPFSHMAASVALRHLGDQPLQAFHSAAAQGLLAAMLSAGAGSSQKAAIRVLFIFEEYHLLTMWGMNCVRQSLRKVGTRSYDIMEVRDRRTEQEQSVYFDVTWLTVHADAKFAHLLGEGRLHGTRQAGGDN